MSIQEITDIINDHVWNVAGIKLEDRKMVYSMAGPNVLVTYDDHELGIFEYVEDAGEMADAIIAAMGDVRGKLTSIRLSKMEQALPIMKERLAAVLGKKAGIMDDLDLWVEVLADVPNHHGMSEAETAQDYPEIALMVSLPEGDRMAQALNTYAPDNPLDVSELAERILDAIG